MYTNGTGSIIHLTKMNLFMSIKKYIFLKVKNVLDLLQIVNPYTFPLNLISYVQPWTWTITIANCKWLIYINKLFSIEVRNLESWKIVGLNYQIVQPLENSEKWELLNCGSWKTLVWIRFLSIQYLYSIYLYNIIQLWDFSRLRFCHRQNVCFLVPTSLHQLSYQWSFSFLFHSVSSI